MVTNHSSTKKLLVLNSKGEKVLLEPGQSLDETKKKKTSKKKESEE